MDRGAWQATAHRVAQSHTRLKRLSTQGSCGLFVNVFTNLVISLKKIDLSVGSIVLVLV